MKRRVFIGLVCIFTVVLVGGGLVSLTMNQLDSFDRAQFLTDEVNHIINRLDLMAWKSVQDIEKAALDETRIRNVFDNIGQMKILMGDLSEKVVSGTFAEKSCGLCHGSPDGTIINLQNVLRRVEDSFAELTMKTNSLITNGLGNELELSVRGISRELDSYQNHLAEIRNVISPMVEHIDAAVSGKTVRIKRTHEMTVILLILLVLAGMIIFLATVTGPMKQLTNGTEAIVKGDYDFRIEMKGRDEAAILAERFNFMAEVLSNREVRLNQKKLELEELNESLERKVRARTKALQEKQEELNKKYAELETVNEEMQSSYSQLQTTASELEEAQSKLQENYNVLKIMNQEFQRANEVKNKFLSIMSHELRTPLTVINGYLSLVLDKDYGRPSKELRDLLVVIKEQGNNQLGLIEDLLDLTRIEAGEFKLQRLSLSVDDLIAKAVENFRPKYEEKEIDVQVKTDDDLPTVYWDFQKILQVFQNLLDNALKFTPEGGKIVISAHSKSDFVEVNIKDNGIGIPKGELDRIFERFYQVDSSSTRRFGGSGLGLSIVREIILAHRGKIFVESEEGEGTSFLILMPIGEPDRSKITEQDVEGAEKGLPREGPLGNGEVILVVDDDEAFLKMMKMILPKEGYQVHSTADSTRVIEYAKKHGADLIMLDLMMPEIDGFEVCRHIRKDAGLSDIPVLVVSAAGSHGVGRKVFEAGADKHITKPFDQRDLFYQIDKLLKGSAKRKKEGSSGGEKKTEPQETRD